MALEPSSCDLCMPTTQAGSVVTKTLLFHTYCSCAGTIIRSCTHNHTTYLVCSHGNQHICFNATYCPWEQWSEIKSICNSGNLISHTQVFSPDEPVSLLFDECVAIDQGGCGGTGYRCGGLAWERAYTSNGEFSISAKAKNLFLSLAESTAQTLNVTSCCLWGDQHGRPLALGSKASGPMGAF
jgi:hypothetical protein